MANLVHFWLFHGLVDQPGPLLEQRKRVSGGRCIRDIGQSGTWKEYGVLVVAWFHRWDSRLSLDRLSRFLLLSEVGLQSLSGSDLASFDVEMNCNLKCRQIPQVAKAKHVLSDSNLPSLELFFTLLLLLFLSLLHRLHPPPQDQLFFMTAEWS